MEQAGLDVREVMGKFTRFHLGPTYFCGSKPIDGNIRHHCVKRLCDAGGLWCWGPQNVHRGLCRVLIDRPLSAKDVVETYVELLEGNLHSHKLNSCVVTAERGAVSKELLQWKMNCIDEESQQYMQYAEKKCRQIKSSQIPFSPESLVWI
ncbi:LOW QUALITY PROTEIN: hypothetical protein ACHAWX_003505 [Stephanocyclus meneghinianus]